MIWITVNDQPFIVIKYLKFQILISLYNSKIYLPLSDIIKSDILKLFKKYQKII